MKVKSALSLLIEKLSTIEDIEYAKKEALEILAYLLNLSPLEVYLHLEKNISPIQLEKYLQARLKRIPLPYILKRAYFWGRPFYIEEGVLIPRLDTELIVEIFLEKGPKEGLVLELGCGSGVISITLLLECPNLKILAIDKSQKALEITKINARHYNVLNRLYLIKGDWLSPLKKKPIFQAILSNPPYISEKEWEELDIEVKLYEPKSALIAGIEGTEFQESLIKEAENYLLKDGFILFEMGYNQSSQIKELAKIYHWNFTFYRDLQNFERVALLWKKKNDT